jgi:hypothetical protein
MFATTGLGRRRVIVREEWRGDVDATVGVVVECVVFKDRTVLLYFF